MSDTTFLGNNAVKAFSQMIQIWPQKPICLKGWTPSANPDALESAIAKILPDVNKINAMSNEEFDAYVKKHGREKVAGG